MPEGPEIRLAADKVANAIAGRPARELFFAFEQLKHYEAELRGRNVLSVEARGKAMLTRFAGGLNIYSHNQLYGKWEVRKAYDYPETKRQLRLAIHNDANSALLYSASSIEVLADEELDSHHFLSRLGPDLLDESLTPEMVVELLMSKRFHRRGFPSLLLDQHFLAGLGNYLRTEVLFVAKVRPNSRPADCTPEQIDAIANACIDLTRQSYHTKGITTDLALAQDLKKQGYTRRQYRWWVFARDGEPCWECGSRILKDTMGGRRIYYCPKCQGI